MKPSVFSEVLGKLRQNHQVKRKFKIVLSLGLVGFLLAGGLIIWAGVTTIQSVASMGTNSNLQEQVLSIKDEILKIPAVTSVGCWNKIQSFLNVEVWLEKPIGDNINNIKLACLMNTPAPCKGTECDSPKKSNRADKQGTI
ncbi:hypothetical protein [uncultured Desulfobulbus sp.]|uniref:hypothetical protein n=1 Tax=uncultured Desulfobulbus sp. TaxID=239745 RepID=UPI0029C7A399|nr:hypothetical protein [uncultured Desulfobulbus sp.]